MHEPIHLVNPVVEIQVFHRFSIFVGRLFQSSGGAVGAVYWGCEQVLGGNGDNPVIDAGRQGEVRIH